MLRLFRVCVFVLLCFTSPVFAGEDVAVLAKAATETLRSGDADAAIEQFDAAFSAGAPTIAMIYNKAIAHFRKGETEIARQLFAQAGDDPKLAAKARYNLGNTDYADAVKLTQGEEADPNAAISKLQSAISHYKRSLAMDRSDPDSRANIESAHKLMRQLQQQQQEQEQQQQNQQQDNSKQDQNQQQQDQQQSESQDKDQKSQDQTSNQTPNDTEQSEEPSEQDGNQNQEQQSDEESQDGSEQQKPEEQQGKQQQQGSEQQEQKSKQENEQQNSQSQDKSQEQSESEEKQAEGEQESESKAEQPEGELKPQNAQQTDAKPQSAADLKPGQRMTKQEARKMLQAVRDRDFRRRLEKLSQLRTRRVRVEKDW